MINAAFRVLLTFNATSLLVIVFLVQKGYSLGHFSEHVEWLRWTVVVPSAASYFFYLLITIMSTGISIWLSKYLGRDEFKTGEVASIEHANNSFLPSYLGYFFVALSIGNWQTLWFVYGVLFVFTYMSQALYFNPLFLLFGYEFYSITTLKGTTVFLISRKRYKKPGDVQIPVAYRINNYTFIERE